MNRIGFAKDIHRLVENRKLILGGVVIPFEKGELAHSDGDVLYPIAAAPNPIIGANIISLKPKEKVDVILLTLLVLLVISVDAPNLSISLLLKEFIL